MKKSNTDIEIIYEDNHIIAVNKNNNDIVQGDKTGDIPLSDKVKAYIKRKYNKPGDVYLGIPHRIDRPVSGIVLFARTSKALERLNLMFRNEGNLIKKTYWAIVGEMPEEDSAELKHYLIKDSERNKSTAYNKAKNGAKESVLTYSMIGCSNKYYFLEVNLKTGRHHQIRCQLAKIGCPIKGDLKYGFPRSNKGGGISLHARSVSFIHPVKKEEVTIIARPPKDEPLWAILEEAISGGSK